MNAVSANRILLIRVGTQLEELLDQLAFVGGCTTELFVTDAISRTPRPTKDVDPIVHVASLLEYHTLSEQLRAKGFTEDTRMGAPLCRWRAGDAVLDVMPTMESVLGFTNRWYIPALETCQPFALTPDLRIQLVQTPYFIATKLEAFFSRGEGDHLMSPDLDDITVVVDGRAELVEEIADAASDVRSALSTAFRDLLATPDFVESIAAHLAPDRASQARRGLILERLERIAVL